MSSQGLAEPSVQRPAPRAVTTGPRHHFFGYYDKCPWDAGERRLLAHQVAFSDRPPEPDDEAILGIVHLGEDNRFEPIGRTRAWNFQQGAMAQWLEPDYQRRVVYNRRDGDRFVGVISDLESAEEHLLDRAVAALARDGSTALSLNFSRLADVRPGYGYAGIPDPWADVQKPADDGIYLIDLASGRSRLLLSVAQIAAFGEDRAGPGTKHWVNHLQFNPEGTRFCFLHRWRGRDGGLQTRLFTANLDGSELYCLADGGMVSHFDWRNSHQLLAWARKSQTVGRAGSKLVRLTGHPWFKRAPLARALHVARRWGAVGWARQRMVGDRFRLFTDRSETTEDVGLDVLREDGHCSYSHDGRWILMDTYPHEDHMRALLLYDTQSERRIDLGRFFSMPKLEGEIRCDLHARWSRTGTSVCIDSSHEGSRQTYVLDVEDVVRG